MEFSAYGLDVKKLPEPFMEFILWSVDGSTSAEQLQICLQTQIEQNAYLSGPWRELELTIQPKNHNDAISLALLSIQHSPGPAVVGRIITGETTTAEWAITQTLQQATAQLAGTAAQLVDGDGCFLAIEAADHLPLWCTPEASANRVFLWGGEVHFVPPLHSDGTPPSTPSLKQAAEHLCNPALATRADDAVQSAINSRVQATTGDAAWQWPQRLLLRVPLAAARLLGSKPWAASAAVEALAAELVTPSSLQKSLLLPMKGGAGGVENALYTCGVTVSRACAAKLANASVLPNKAMAEELYAALVDALGTTAEDNVPDTKSQAWQLRFGVALARGLDAIMLHSPAGVSSEDVDALGPLCMRAAVLTRQAALLQALAEAEQQAMLEQGNEGAHEADSMQWLLPLQEAAGGGVAAAEGGVGETLPQFLQFLSSAHDVRGVGGSAAGTMHSGNVDAARPLGGPMAAYARDEEDSGSGSDGEEGGEGAKEGMSASGGGQPEDTDGNTGFAAMAQSWRRTAADVEGGGWMDSGSDSEGGEGGSHGGWQEEAVAAAGELMDEELGRSSMKHSFMPRDEQGGGDEERGAVSSEGGSDCEATAAVPIPSEDVMANNYVSSLTASMQSGHGAGPAAVTLSHLD